MRIRSIIPVLFSLLFIVACRNEEDREEDPQFRETESNYDDDASSTGDRSTSPAIRSSKDAVEEEKPNYANGNDDEIGNRSSSRSSGISEGKYIKDGETDPNCACYCINLTYSGTTELCLKEETIFVTARMSRANGDLVNLYFVEAASRNTEGDDIPWNDFDKNTPIATITPAANGQMELDWLGFTINGDLAMDYAIYGKKTLEGNYKKN